MIFITLGSQKFQFNRLLKKIDELIERQAITEEVIAQIGFSDYKPKKYQYYDFMDREEFSSYMDKADIVITHAGTGAIITAIKKKKKVIAVPRLAKYGEHVDDHQLQIVNEFMQANLIDSILEMDQLEEKLLTIHKKEFAEYISNTQVIVENIDTYIMGLENKD